MKIEFIDLQGKDLQTVKAIYDHYILHSTATFHTDPVSLEELKSIIPVAHPKYRSFMVYADGEICGYCYLSRYKPRQAYDRTAEITVYLKEDFTGKGIGIKIMNYLESVALQNNISVLMGIITLENQMSVKLLEKCGYEKCAHFKKVGQKFDRILDVVAYQKIIKE
jgi:L-amino acid N-acyltransferase YncA